jgi:phosphogluconate dehydratase
VLTGNLGQCILKTSALPTPDVCITAPAVVFEEQDELGKAVKAGQREKDCIVVVRNQGPKARGMPELHKLTPPLSVLQNKGFKVALITDGRMSGASGTVPAAIHLTPEAADGGLISKIRTGDMITLDAVNSILMLNVEQAELDQREIHTDNLALHHQGVGRELFGNMRRHLSSADTGACSLFD